MSASEGVARVSVVSGEGSRKESGSGGAALTPFQCTSNQTVIGSPTYTTTDLPAAAVWGSYAGWA